jgi:cell division protein FtsL
MHAILSKFIFPLAKAKSGISQENKNKKGDASPMGQPLIITNSNSFAFGGRKKFSAGREPVRIGPLTLNFLLVVLICAAGVFYIFEVNDVATQGYKIRELEKRAQELRDNNEKLKIQEAELRSMYNIEEKTKNLNMVAPESISYMALPGNVAMK